MKNRIKKLRMVATATVLMLSNVMGVSAATLEDCFDADYYASTYEDVKEVFGNDQKALYKHYKDYGIEEGRLSNQYFDVKVYRERYEDLNAAFGDNWDAYYTHYLTHGLWEGRSALASGEVFDAIAYADMNPDLKEAFGYDVLALYNHYITFGMKENRLTHEPVVEDSTPSNSNDASGSNDAEDTTVSSGDAGNDTADAEVDDAYFKEWLNNLYQSLLKDDYMAVLPMFSDFDKVWDKCAEYEYVGWSQNEYSESTSESDMESTTTITFNETAYKFTMEDGTVMGIVIYTDNNNVISNISAFVSYTDDNGFGYIGAGDHLVQRHYTTNMYSYIIGDVFYIVPHWGDVVPFDMSDGSVAVVWHV